MSALNYNPLIGLQTEILGSGTILNNGVTPNTIYFGMTNNNLFGASNAEQVDISVTTDTKIYVWFVVDDKQATSKNPDREWALTSYADFHSSIVKVNVILPDGKDDTIDWNISRNKPLALPGVNPALTASLDGWELTRKSETKIKPGGTLQIQISGLVTGLPDGPSVGYFRWQSPIGETMLTFGPIQKTPHVLRRDKVGVGTNHPNVTLDVIGGIRARGGAPGVNGINNNGYFFNPPGDNDSGMSSSSNGQIEFYAHAKEAMRVMNPSGELKDIKVGIGVKEPGAQLHVSSDGLTQYQEAFRVGGSGKIAIDSDGVIGGRMTVLQNGRVGLGTATPGSHLHIQNSDPVVLIENTGGQDSWAQLRLKTASEQWTIGTSDDYISNSLYIQSTKGGSLWMNPNGAIGINTSTPAGTLDINGTIKIKGGSFSYSGTAMGGTTVNAPTGTTDDWNIFVSVNDLSAYQHDDSNDDALISISCYAIDKNTHWEIVANGRVTGDISGTTGRGTNHIQKFKVNYLIVPK